MNTYVGMLAYFVPLVIILLFYMGHKRKVEKRGIALREEAVETGMTEPASLHPIVDPNKCFGSGACVSACPEKEVLMVVGGKAELVMPSSCIGHGACAAACPTDAITLVFGTEKRGVDIPLVDKNFQTNVPGMFIAGELGGMGLIRNAIEQGCRAMDSIRKFDGIGKGSMLDVIVIGAGPAGFSASLSAMEAGLRFMTIEQDTLGGTVAHFPRNKLVMTAPVQMPMIGRVKFTETTKEALLEFWQQVEQDTGVEINYEERVDSINQTGDGFEVVTTRGSYQSRAVLLAIGRRGTPRKLNVPGEDFPKVVYRLIDPEQYRNQHVLVVGGGDAALEAATSIAVEPGTTTTLSYRSGSFSRAKAKNRELVKSTEASGKLSVLLNSNIKAIAPDHVEIDNNGTPVTIANDAVIVCAGGILPTPFLKKIGITVETKHGTV